MFIRMILSFHLTNQSPEATIEEMLSPQNWISVAVVGGGFLFLTAWEMVAPLRRTLEPKLRHVIRNLTVGGTSLAILTLLQAPVLVPAAEWAAHHRVGLLNRVAVRAP